ncbi:MAG: glycosyltransferase family 25 protein [Kiritimatiellae bacterium]|nr:glycosyltransferase family 25 protein [Kiritimatiellia bacterium]
MKIYVINLDRSPERLAETKRQLDAAGLPFERFPAVDGRALSPAERREACPPLRFWLANGFRSVLPGEIGCALSHRGVWERIADGPGDVAAVFEDDAVLDADALRDVLATAERDDDPAVPTVWLMQEGLPAPARLDGRRFYDILETDDVGHVFSTRAYALNRAAAKRLAAILAPVANVADTWSAYARCGVRVLAPVRPCAFARKTPSDIGPASGFLWRFGWYRRRVHWRRWKLSFRLDLLLKRLEGKRP